MGSAVQSIFMVYSLLHSPWWDFHLFLAVSDPQRGEFYHFIGVLTTLLTTVAALLLHSNHYTILLDISAW